jgi:addiction module HigA family antidote
MKAKKIDPVHPGEILLHDFMEPLHLSQYALAKALGVTPMRVSQMHSLADAFGLESGR